MKYAIIIVLLLISCVKDKNTPPLVSKQEKATVIDTAKAINEIVKSPVLNNSMLKEFEVKRDEIISTLKTSSSSQANKLYDDYFISTNTLLGKLTASESQLLDQFYNNDYKTKLLIKKKTQELAEYDLEFDELGEGYVEIRTKPDYYFEIFKNYVSTDYLDYLEITKEENKVMYSADAGLMISFETLGDRIGTWEAFRKKHPQTRLLKTVKEICYYYQQDYLFGMDNTPTIELGGNQGIYIYPENLAEFKRFKSQYPNSPTNKLIDLFLENFRNENVHALIVAQQEKF